MTDENPSRPSLRILVIEDDTLTRVVLCKVLARMNYVTFEAGEGAEGMKIFREQMPDVVITDLQMPGQEGLETIALIKKESPATKVVAMSGGGATHSTSFLNMAKKLGADHTLQKPFRPEDILDLLKNIEAPGK